MKKLIFCASEILDKVRQGTVPPFRPRVDIDRDIEIAAVVKIMELSWEEVPVSRPSFMQIRSMLKKINK